MIAQLRRRHRWAWSASVLLLPVLVIAATLARQPAPRQQLPSTLLAAIVGPTVGDVEELASSEDLWPSSRIQTGLERDARGLLLRLWPREDLQRPDLLLYWSKSMSLEVPPRALPADAVLLGQLAGTQARRLRLPAGTRAGTLLLYSLAHQEMIDHADLTPLLRAGGLP